jgi:hypothetical protein
MTGFISMQPNGLYCRFSHVIDSFTHMNMTREEYINNATGNVSKKEEAIDILENHLVPFERALELVEKDFKNTDPFKRILELMHDERVDKKCLKL